MPRGGSKAPRLMDYREAIKAVESVEGEVRVLTSHSLLAALYANIIASSEGLDARTAVAAALLHDYGKLGSREAGAGELEYLARESRRLRELLSRMDVEPEEALRAIMGEGRVGDVVWDADLLSKLGVLGLYSFFSKWAVRGKDLIAAVVENLPRELTIAVNAARLARTRTGRKLASTLADRSLEAYKLLIDELRSLGLDVSVEGENVRGVRVLWVRLGTCPYCGSRMSLERGWHEGRFCKGPVFRQVCGSCGASFEARPCIQWLLEGG